MKYNLSEETKRNISYLFEQKLGITYEEFENLDIEIQKELLKKHKDKNTDFVKRTKEKDLELGKPNRNKILSLFKKK